MSNQETKVVPKVSREKTVGTHRQVQFYRPQRAEGMGGMGQVWNSGSYYHMVYLGAIRHRQHNQSGIVGQILPRLLDNYVNSSGFCHSVAYHDQAEVVV